MGEKGPQGKIGADGMAGIDGVIRHQGLQGDQGLMGLTGPAGAPGPAGPAGSENYWIKCIFIEYNSCISNVHVLLLPKLMNLPEIFIWKRFPDKNKEKVFK